MEETSIQINGYQIKNTLGHGGMATVYLAIQESFEREVAIKVMADQLSSDPAFGERFLREARIVSRLIHPNIVTVYDVGVVNNHHYLSMEYINGQDLKEKLPSISLLHIIKVIKEVALALDYAGRKGYVHRDIKPENVMISDEDGRAVLMDFGIAKAFDTVSEMTQTGTAIGTPYYMSPEQAKGNEIDWRSDLYSLGVVFFQLLTGGVPFDGDSAVTVGIKHLTDPVPQISDYLQATFQPIINKLMAKTPSDRYQNGSELIQVLNDITDEEIQTLNKLFTADSARDKNTAINHHVDVPLTDSTKITPQDQDATQVLQIPQTPAKPVTAKNMTKVAVALSFSAIAIGAGFIYYQNNQQPKVAEVKETTTAPSSKTNNTPTNVIANTAKTKTITETNTSTQTEVVELAPPPPPPQQEKLTKLLAQANQIKEKLKADIQIEWIDELHQTYQLIALLDKDHPELLSGKETLKTAYNTLTEKQIAAGDLEGANKTLYKKIKRHPETKNSIEILMLKQEIDKSFRIVELLNKAERLFEDNKFTGEGNDNAQHQYKQVLKITPEHPKAIEGIQAISARYHQMAKDLISQGQYKKAQQYIHKGLSVTDTHKPLFVSLQNKIDEHFRAQNQLAKKQESKQKTYSQLIAQAKKANAQKNLIPPTKDNAYDLYKQALAIKPDSTLAPKGLAKIERKLAQNIPYLLKKQAFDEAEFAIEEINQLFPNSTLSKQLSKKLANEKQQAAEDSKAQVSKIIIKGEQFTQVSGFYNGKVKADKHLYVGIKYKNFGGATSILQAELFDGSKTVKLATTPVIVAKDTGSKIFKISSPLGSYNKAGYQLTLTLNNELLISSPFTIEK